MAELLMGRKTTLLFLLSPGAGSQVALGRVNGGTVPALSLLPSGKPEPMQL